MFETFTKYAQGITQRPTLKHYNWFKTFSCIGQFNWSKCSWCDNTGYPGQL